MGNAIFIGSKIIPFSPTNYSAIMALIYGLTALVRINDVVITYKDILDAKGQIIIDNVKANAQQDNEETQRAAL